jgi:amidase
VSEPPIGMNVEGVVSRSVRDTAALLDAITWRSPWWPAPPLPRPLLDEVGLAPPRLRVGVWTEAFNGSTVDEASAQAATDCALVMQTMGHLVEVGASPTLSDPELWDHAKAAMTAAAATEANAWTARLGRQLEGDDFESRTWSMVQAGRAMSAPDLLHVMERMQVLAAQALSWWERFDLLITPTTAAPASVLGDYLTSYESGKGSAFTRPFNVTGQPAISIPFGWPSDGLPRGVQLIAAYGREDLLIRVASAIETAAPWAHRRPTMLNAEQAARISTH